MSCLSVSKSVKRFGCVRSCVLQKKRFPQRKKYTESRRWILQHNIPERFYSSIVFLHLCYKSIFSELGQILPHPTHDSAKSSPNVRLSCPTQYCLYRCSQLVFFSPCETLDQPLYCVTFCSPESTPDAGIFFFVVTTITQTTPFFYISFCKQLTPWPTTVSHFLTQMDVPSEVASRQPSLAVDRRQKRIRHTDEADGQIEAGSKKLVLTWRSFDRAWRRRKPRSAGLPTSGGHLTSQRRVT